MNVMATIENLDEVHGPGTPLGNLGWMAVDHWREHLPAWYASLVSEGRLIEEALRAEEKTNDEMFDLEMDLRRRGYSADQAVRAAREVVLPRHILLPAENATTT